MRITPQEIEVWYILPAIRREFARIMVQNHNLTQKEVSSVLGITRSAVNQYLKNKRANKITLTPEIKAEIRLSASNILEEKSSPMEEIQKILHSMKRNHITCDLHKNYEPTVPKDCCACLK